VLDMEKLKAIKGLDTGARVSREWEHEVLARRGIRC
jgi:hypothetical protein